MEDWQGGIYVVPDSKYIRKVDGKKQKFHKISRKLHMRKKCLEKIDSEKLKHMKDEDITKKE